MSAERRAITMKLKLPSLSTVSIYGLAGFSWIAIAEGAANIANGDMTTGGAYTALAVATFTVASVWNVRGQ